MKRLIVICSTMVLFVVGYISAGTWTTVNFPGATHTRIHDISGNSYVGLYTDGTGDHGFYYDGVEWKTLEYPGATSTQWVYGIDGTTIVGMYNDGPTERGFIYVVPEPCTLLLLGLGGLALRLRQKR